MVDNKERFLFGSLEDAYREERVKFERARTNRFNHELQGRILAIISATSVSSDDIHAARGAYVEENNLVLTGAALEYASLMEVGETIVTKTTKWMPLDQKTVDEKPLDFSVRFQSEAFVTVKDQSKRREGPVRIYGQLTDADGVSTDMPIAVLMSDKQTNELKLLYGFGSEIEYGSADHQELKDIIQQTERKLGIVQRQ